MRWAASWVLYWTGDAVSRVFRWFDWTAPVLYPVYNRLMNWAARIQGDGGGPWQTPEKQLELSENQDD